MIFSVFLWFTQNPESLLFFNGTHNDVQLSWVHSFFMISYKRNGMINMYDQAIFDFRMFYSFSLTISPFLNRFWQMKYLWKPWDKFYLIMIFFENALWRHRKNNFSKKIVKCIFQKKLWSSRTYLNVSIDTSFVKIS